jgi:ribosomal protein S18 acetylase RimI-like enzyme
MIYATTVSNNKELEQIISLQQQNLKQHLSAEEKQSQGFVTVVHTPAMLQQMHQYGASIIAKDDDALAGYALTMMNDYKNDVPELLGMFAVLDAQEWKGKGLPEYRYYVMGQICVSSNYRGLGVFDMLYQKHKDVYQPQFDLLVTEISTSNTRSQRAHERVGFKTIYTYRDVIDEWNVVVWDWS